VFLTLNVSWKKVQTANRRIFFAKPRRKNATIGEKSMPPLWTGSVSLIGLSIGSVTW